MKQKGRPVKSQRSFQLSLRALVVELTGKQSGHCPQLALVRAGEPEMCLQLVLPWFGIKRGFSPRSQCLCFSLSPSQHLRRAEDRPAAQEDGRDRLPPRLRLRGFPHQAGCQGETQTCPRLLSLQHRPRLVSGQKGTWGLCSTEGFDAGCWIHQQSRNEAKPPQWAATEGFLFACTWDLANSTPSVKPTARSTLQMCLANGFSSVAVEKTGKGSWGRRLRCAVPCLQPCKLLPVGGRAQRSGTEHPATKLLQSPHVCVGLGCGAVTQSCWGQLARGYQVGVVTHKMSGPAGAGGAMGSAQQGQETPSQYNSFQSASQNTLQKNILRT